MKSDALGRVPVRPHCFTFVSQAPLAQKSYLLHESYKKPNEYINVNLGKIKAVSLVYFTFVSNKNTSVGSFSINCLEFF